MGLSIFDEAIALAEYAEIVNGDGTAYKAVVVSERAQRRIDAMLLTSDETVTLQVQISLNDSSSDFPIGTVAVPAGSGHTGVATVDAIAALAPAVLASILLPPFFSMRARVMTAVTAGKTLQFTTLGGTV